MRRDLELPPGEVTNSDYVMTRDLTASNFEIHAGITGSFGLVPEKSHFIDYCYLSVPPKVQMSKVDTRNETLRKMHASHFLQIPRNKFHQVPLKTNRKCSSPIALRT